MLPHIILIFSFLITLQSYSQEFFTGTAEYTFFDNARNREIPALIYYPANESGSNVPVANSTFGFPVVSFGHGFVIDPAAYGWLGEELATRGYIFVAPATEGQLLPAPDHLNFGRDIRFCGEEIIRLGGQSGNPLSGKVLPRYAMMGHSMGGGATYLGAAETDEVTTTITFAAADTDPSSIAAALNVAAPSLVIAAEEDCVTPVSTNQEPMYANLSNSEKAFVNISGASHCNFTDGSASLCYLGEGLPCIGFGPFIPRSEQHSRILEVLIPWLDNYLKAECDGGEDFVSVLETGQNLGNWTFQLEGAGELACAANCEAALDLTATVESGNILLNWSPVEDALGYRVQAKLNGSLVGSLNVFTDELEITQLSPSQPYEFRVRAYCPNAGFGNFTDWEPLLNGPGITVQQVENSKAALVLENVAGRANLAVRQIDGSPIFSQEIRGEEQVLINELSRGLYLATLTDERGSSVVKFTIH